MLVHFLAYTPPPFLIPNSRYLLLIDQIDLLSRLFQNIIIPEIVRSEMIDPGAPPILQQWIANSPPWLIIQTVSVIDETLSTLDPGEQTAITLAQRLSADLVIIDERRGRQIACDRELSVIGTIGILDDAANQELINLAENITQLQQIFIRRKN